MRSPKRKLIVFTRIPELGKNKTRLIPALGEEGATKFHSRLARHAIGRASEYGLRSGSGSVVEIHVTGGSTMDARHWLGGGSFRIQGQGSLGDRLSESCEESFGEGYGKVVLIGTDCPRLDAARIGEAFGALERCDVVVGPAADGGYYLLGLRKSERNLFRDVDWGGPLVLKQTLERAGEAGLSVELLGELPDVDTPEDLKAGEAALDEGERVSVIIPTLNESGFLGECLAALKRDDPWEILVSDGGSTDATRELAESSGVRVVSGAGGRAAQMNRAASLASGELLFFLHADTVPPPRFTEMIREALSTPEVAAGAFSLGLSDDLGAAALIERLVGFRCDMMASPYGDQGLFVRRGVFEEIGGFPSMETLEDLEIVTKLKKRGRVVVLKDPVRSSGRRWVNDGLIRTFLRHQVLLAARAAGLPNRLIAHGR